MWAASIEVFIVNSELHHKENCVCASSGGGEGEMAAYPGWVWRCCLCLLRWRRTLTASSQCRSTSAWCGSGLRGKAATDQDSTRRNFYWRLFFAPKGLSGYVSLWFKLALVHRIRLIHCLMTCLCSGTTKALQVLLIQPKMDTLRVLQFVIWEMGPEQFFFLPPFKMLRAEAAGKFPDVLLR